MKMMRKMKPTFVYLAIIGSFSTILCLITLFHQYRPLRISSVEENKNSNNKLLYTLPTNAMTIGPKTPYLTRENMGKCPPKFGRIMVLVFVQNMNKTLENYYGVAQSSLECYLRSTNYTFMRLDLTEDIRAKKYCVQHKQLFFRKHCLASAYLPDTDWLLVLDADTGVVNPNHCIEEWIDDRVDLIFYERFFNWEIVSGNYLVKNTPFAQKFLMDWANMEFSLPKFSSADNGALQLHILKTVLPNANIEINACTKYWQRSENYDTLMAYTTCVRSALGAQRIWAPKLRILRRAHGFCRDWFITSDGWAENDFMLHGWKAMNINFNGWQSPFEKVPNASECTDGYLGWNWRADKRISIDAVRKQLAAIEKSSANGFPKKARIHAHLSEPEVGECYPNCDDQI